MPEDHGADTPDLQLRKPEGPLLAPSEVSVKDLPRSISAKVTNKIDAASGKFIVSAWDPTYGELPADKKFALSHWSATPGAPGTTPSAPVGNRQLCGDLSGAVVQAFVEKHPRTSSPEPDAP